MDDADARREARAKWPIRKFALDEEPLVDTRDESTLEDRIALAWRLSCEMWTVAGGTMPTYRRAEMPGIVIRP